MKESIKAKFKKPSLWLIIVLTSVLIWVFGFYWASRPRKSNTLTVWIGASFTLNSDVRSELGDEMKKYGISSCDIRAYDPLDSYYSGAFALQSHAVDIYVLNKNEAIQEAQAGIFKELPSQLAVGNVVEYQDVNIGVQFAEDYYVFICNNTKKSEAVIISAVEILLNYGLNK